jgi:hypothetical protein
LTPNPARKRRKRTSREGKVAAGAFRMSAKASDVPFEVRTKKPATR